MLRPSQIIAIFGVFLSMFYIFKYGGANPAYANTLCQNMIDIQMEIVAEVSPLVRRDKTDDSFDEKLQRAINSLQSDEDFRDRHNQLNKVKNQLEGRACPSPNMVQMTRLVVQST